jgi:nucleoside-diphosphate-sugar epimerase
VAQSKKKLLVVGANALVGDVADQLLRTQEFDRVETVGLERGGGVEVNHRLDLLARGAARSYADILAAVAPTHIVDLWRSESAVRPERVGRYDGAAAEATVEGLTLWRSRGGKPCRLVVLSSTAVYGASEASPIMRIEADVLAPLPQRAADAYGRWVLGLREREAAFAALAATGPWQVLCLRTAAVVGGTLRSEISDYLDAALPVRVAGFDPPVQLLHYADLVDALERAAVENVSGILNVVGRGVVPLSRLAALSGRIAVPVPESVARWLAPSAFGTEALKWRCVADGRRAEQVLGFHPRFSTEEALAA